MNLPRAFSLVVLAAIAGSSATACSPGYRYNRTARRYGGDVPFTLVNDTPYTACYVHMSPSTDRNWGSDWLGRYETIPSGGGRTFAIQGGPAWDIQVQTCDHQVLAEARQVPLMGPSQLSIGQLRGGPTMAQPPAVYAQPMQKLAADSSGN